MSRFLRLCLVLLLPLVAASQQASPPPQTQPAEPAKVRPMPGGTNGQVILDVQVTDGSGASVRGLQQQDFTLADGKQPLNIVSFQAVDRGAASPADSPVEIVLVIDAVNAPFALLTTERNEVKKFLLQNGGKLPLPISLVFFSQAGTKLQNSPSRDGNAMAALYDQYATGLMPTNLDAPERFDLSIKTLTSLAAYEAKRPGRKLMMWMSPGWPLLSGGNLELTPKDFQWLFDSKVALSGALRQARVTLYDIDPRGVSNSGGTRLTFYQDFLKDVTTPKKMQPGYLSLQVLAVQSGGRVFNSTNDLTGAIANCAADADSFYVLSFNAPPADGPNDFHSLGVTVDKPGLTARTRTGLYVQP
jgi:VWFA-related protein